MAWAAGASLSPASADLRLLPIPSARWFRLIVGLAVALLAAAIVGALSTLFTERMWARALGFGASFDRRIGWWAASWSVALTVSLACVFASLWRVQRISRAVFGESGRLNRRVSTPVVVAGSVIVAPLLGDRWTEVMLAVSGWREQVIGPTTLGVDPGFYVFRLPLLQAVTSWLIALSALCLALTIVASALSGLIFRSGRGFSAATPAVLRLLTVPFIWFCGWVAVGMWWARFAVASRSNGQLVGLFSLQHSTVVPMLSVLALGAVALGAAMVPTLRRGGTADRASFDLWDELLLARVGVAVWVLAALVGGVLIPAAAQSAQPLPRSTEVEAMIRHSAATIGAYDLDDALFALSTTAARDRSARNPSAPGPVALMNAGLDDFAVRQNDAEDKSWAVVADQSDSSYGITGPGKSPAGLNESAIGLKFSAPMKRLLFALRFRSADLLSSQADQRVVVHHRDVVERAHAVAPFLRYSSRPYLVTLGDKPFWVLDAYTTSNSFPGGQRFPARSTTGDQRTILAGHVNYVRNSVKVIIDARSGRTRFYRTDLTDPIARTWARALPGLLKPPTAMAADFPDLGRQLRYPVDLLALQGDALGSYHSRQTSDLLDATTKWRNVELVSAGGVTPGIVVPFALGEDKAPVRSAVRVLEPVRQQSPDRYLIVGRSTPTGGDRLVIDVVKGPRVDEVRSMIDKSADVNRILASITKNKRSAVFRDLLPVPTEKSGMIYALGIASRDTQDRVRSEAVVLVGGEGLVVGKNPSEAWSNYLLRGSTAPVTNASAVELERLQTALQDTERRLADSEAVIDSLRQRVSVLESSVPSSRLGAPSTTQAPSPPSAPPTSTPTVK